MFSVIVPLYNKAKYIEKCLQSVFNQTFKEFELIVIDDGSSDDGYSIAKYLCNSLVVSEWSKSPLTKVLKQENRGVSTTRNYGVELSKFDYIAFLDADDWWATDYLQKMKSHIDKYPEAGIYGSSYYKVKNNRFIPAMIGVEPEFTDGIINYFEAYAITLWMPIWTGSTIIKKSIFDESGGFNPKLKLGEDFDLWARIASRYPVAFLNKPLAFYNQDVDVNTRAVGVRLYETNEHMLFTKYSDELVKNPDFVYLYERLALYGLQPYYAVKKNWKEVKSILKTIHWKNHELKYFIYYRLFSPSLLKLWLSFKVVGSKIKKMVLK